MFGEAPKRAVWRDRGAPGGDVGVGGAGELEAKERRSLYIGNKRESS